MASAVEPQQSLNRSSDNGVPALLSGNGGARPAKDPLAAPSSNLSHQHTPPSPPVTETDIDVENSAGESQGRATVETNNAAQEDPRGAHPPPVRIFGAPEEDDDDDEDNAAFYSPGTSPPQHGPPPVASPPYWMNQAITGSEDPSRPHGHSRNISSSSIDSDIPTGGIMLRDNENSSLDDRGSACWAKSVAITGYTIVNGSMSNIGAFVVWNIRVETLNGSYMNIRKRYSEFDDFRWRLVQTFPNFEAAVPELPPKSLIAKFRPKFLEKRRGGLQYFLNCIMLNPEFSGSPVMKEFLFA